MQRQLPAQLPGVQVDGATAGDAADHADALFATVVEIDLLAEGLVAAHQRRGGKAQEAQRVRHPPVSVRLDDGLADRDVEPPLDHAGVKKAEGLFGHFPFPFTNWIKLQEAPKRRPRPCRCPGRGCVYPLPG